MAAIWYAGQLTLPPCDLDAEGGGEGQGGRRNPA